MFNSVYLDIAIGMIFIFLLYSLLATAVQELIATWLNLRGKNLFKAIGLMLDDMKLGDTLSKRFYDHPLIKKITFSGKGKYPSYIGADVFSQVLEDVIPDVYLGPDKKLTTDQKINLLPAGEFKRITNTLCQNIWQETGEVFQNWFNISMDRLSGYYKRKTQNRLLIIGFCLAVAFNVNSLAVFKRLSTDKKARERLVTQATQFAQLNQNYDSLYAKITARSQGQAVSDSILKTNDSLLNRFNEQRKAIKELLAGDIEDAKNAVGIGWESIKGKNIFQKLGNMPAINWLLALFGWLITAVAISMGAPIWFDLLQKLVKLRGTGIKPK